ncbi:MAG TPA: aldehyde dehydrogenase family protein, partial [candidate division Zixibacteria bacterium]
MADAKIYKNYINGEWIDSVTGKKFENRNPADTRDLLGYFQDSNESDVKRAIDAARDAFKKWRLVPAPKRGEMVFRVAELLVKRKEDYARQMTQ